MQFTFLRLVASADIFPSCFLLAQWVESSHLEPEAQTEDPVKYHDAWKALCSAGCVRSSLSSQLAYR